MLVSKIISDNKNAPVIVIFGGNEQRRNDVLLMIKSIGEITAYGALSEEEGLEMLKTLPKVNLVLIGGRYDDNQRIRIRQYVRNNLPGVKTTEPGYDYQYDNKEIEKDIRMKLGID